MQPPFPAWSQPPSPSLQPAMPAIPTGTPPSARANKGSQDRSDQPKKPRHRHSAFQLAALNELYEKNEHPSLEERTSLAERLGMETKTVNSWFQNKRASSKKRHKGPSTASPTGSSIGASSSNSSKNGSAIELPPISALIASVAAPPASNGAHPLYMHDDYGDYSDDDLGRLQNPQQQSLFYAGNPQHRHLFEADDNQPRKGRSRPSAAQTEELRKLYEVNAHPSKEEREELGDRIGMRYQSVTNWFQNQRSIAKKRKEEEDALLAAATSSRSPTYSPFPPAPGAAHPSLSVPPATGHPSLAFSLAQSTISAPPIARVRRSSSAAPGSYHHRYPPASRSHSPSRPSSPRVQPYRTPSDRSHASRDHHPRPRRTRPEPHQLEALKGLFRRTATPSIEERGALALEVGMDVGKVTNWFRNLRQTARKRARARRGDVDEDELEEGEVDEDVDMDVDMDADNISLATYNDNSRSVSRSGTPVHSMGQHLAASASFQSQPLYFYDEDDEEEAHKFGAMMRRPLHIRRRHEHGVISTERSRPFDHFDPADLDSHMGSEEDYQEAVTPSPESSPPPSLSVSETFAQINKVVLGKTVVRNAVPGRETFAMSVNVMGGIGKKETGVRVEDALLLLSFHNNNGVH